MAADEWTNFAVHAEEKQDLGEEIPNSILRVQILFPERIAMKFDTAQFGRMEIFQYFRLRTSVGEEQVEK